MKGIHMTISDNLDPSVLYEDLARAAFNNCKKWGDPWKYAAQEVYTRFVPEPDLRGKRALSTILIKLIIDNSESNHVKQLQSLEDQVWEASSQEQIIKIIKKAIDLYNQLKNQE